MESLIHRMSAEEFKVVKALRKFFDSENFDEVYMQNRLGILPACEDPKNLTPIVYMGEVWPLPQTNQMWLEDELLQNPDLSSIHTLTTSYRQEPDPVPGRHKIIFPLYEFESKGNFEDLLNLTDRLMKFLGFPLPEGSGKYPRIFYEDACKKYGVSTIEREEEKLLERDYGPVVFLIHFPIRSGPFWNMKIIHEEGDPLNLSEEQITDPNRLTFKMDIIGGGMEIGGTAERSCDVHEMKTMFHTIVNGEYARDLNHKFTKRRVDEEVDRFLGQSFFSRYGGGIGVDRLISTLKKYNLYDGLISTHF